MPAPSSSAPRPSARRAFRAFAVTAPGLEALCAAELRPLLDRPPAPEPGGVAFDASAEELYDANLWLRTASRVTVRLAEFEAASFRDLERLGRLVPWETIVTANQPIRLRVTCRKSRLYHSDAVAERVAAAVAYRLGGETRYATARGEDDDETDDDGNAAPRQLVVVRFLHDQCTISADSSGALLHRRGYRQAVAKAPLRETLGAALLLAAGYDGSAPLVDPLCGSGTIPIEAAMIARRLAPGRRRRFAFERWPGFDRATWDALLARADDEARPTAPQPILGSDRDAGAVAAAQANAERAGVAADVTFADHAISSAPAPAGLGWIATNPPYGKRVGDARPGARAHDRVSDRAAPDTTGPVRDLWARLGQWAAVRCPGWQMAAFAPDPALARQLGFPLRPALRTTNGGLPVQVVAGTVPRG